MEVGSKDAQILGQNKDMDFDWEQFVIQDDEDGLDSSKVGAEAAGELVKDPKLDLKRRLKAGLRGKHTYQQKHFVKVVDINTGEYQDYQFQGKGKNDAGMVLFTKDIPEE